MIADSSWRRATVWNHAPHWAQRKRSGTKDRYGKISDVPASPEQSNESPLVANFVFLPAKCRLILHGATLGNHGLKCQYLAEILDTPAAMLVMTPIS